jgi:hypothetical protein
MTEQFSSPEANNLKQEVAYKTIEGIVEPLADAMDKEAIASQEAYKQLHQLTNQERYNLGWKELKVGLGLHVVEIMAETAIKAMLKKKVGAPSDSWLLELPIRIASNAAYEKLARSVNPQLPETSTFEYVASVAGTVLSGFPNVNAAIYGGAKNIIQGAVSMGAWSKKDV